MEKFSFAIDVPVHKPTEEELAQLEDVELESLYQDLIDEGKATREEVFAYIEFVTRLTSSAPFMYDEFIRAYRRRFSSEN